MKERLVSALVGLLVLAVVFFFYPTMLFNITMGLVSLIAVFEVLNATDTLKNRGFAVVSASFSILLPFIQEDWLRPYAPLIIFIQLVSFLLLIIKDHSRVTFINASFMLLIGIFIPLFFCSAIYIRDNAGEVLGMYYLLFALGSAWLCDTGAFFAGYFFGKRKMAPEISPKKTVEGAVGGIITAVVLNLAVAFVYSKILGHYGHAIQLNYWLIGILSPFLALLGMLGDLMASVIKRQHNVKDYGHIMPGHGGIMDRFDSVLMTLPAVYIITLYLPVAMV